LFTRKDYAHTDARTDPMIILAQTKFTTAGSHAQIKCLNRVNGLFIIITSAKAVTYLSRSVVFAALCRAGLLSIADELG